MRRVLEAGLVLVLVVSACSQADEPEEALETTSSTSAATTTSTELTTTTEAVTTTAAQTTTTSTPADSSPPTTVPAETVAMVVGDFGTGTDSQFAVADEMERTASDREATALITTGDNFYVDDIVAAWDEPYGWVAEQGLAIYASWGNHDIESPERIELVEEALAPPGRWYAARLGSANLIVLDANRPTDGGQRVFLRKQLERFARQPVIVAFHQPAHSCSRHGSTTDVIESWQFLFERSGVDLVLSGHDHNYQRIFQGGVTYLVTGGGGRNLYEVAECPPGTMEPLVANDRDHHFLVLTIKTGTIEVEAISANGDLIDEFSVANTPPRQTGPTNVR